MFRNIFMEIRNIEENFFAVCRHWGSLNSSLIELEYISAMSTGVCVSDINWAWNEAPLDDESLSRVQEIKEYYKRFDLRFEWWVYPAGQSPVTANILQNSGLRLFAKVPCMVAPLEDALPEIEHSGKITISQVNSRKDLRLWKDISFNGFEMPSRTKKAYGAFVSTFIIDTTSPQKLFLAYWNGKPVSTSLVFTNQNSAGLYYISTLPEYRNKGCGRAITLASMLYAKKCGFKGIALQATPSGEKVYVKAGFKEYCKAEIYKLQRSI